MLGSVCCCCCCCSRLTSLAFFGPVVVEAPLLPFHQQEINSLIERRVGTVTSKVDAWIYERHYTFFMLLLPVSETPPAALFRAAAALFFPASLSLSPKNSLDCPRRSTARDLRLGRSVTARKDAGPPSFLWWINMFLPFVFGAISSHLRGRFLSLKTRRSLFFFLVLLPRKFRVLLVLVGARGGSEAKADLLLMK